MEGGGLFWGGYYLLTSDYREHMPTSMEGRLITGTK